MSIEERIDHDQLNIHQFRDVPEHPEYSQDDFFYVERELGLRSKNELLGLIKAARENSAEEWSKRVRDFKILWPKEPLPDGMMMAKKQLTAALDAIDFINFPGSSIELAANIVIARPDLASKISKRQWEILLFNLENSPRSTEEIVNGLAHLRIINPKPPISSETQRKVKANVSIMRNWAALDRGVLAKACMRLVDSAYDPGLAPENWIALKDILETKTGSEKYDLATAMQICAATEVNITSPGVISLKLPPPPPYVLNQSTPPMPEARKF